MCKLLIEGGRCLACSNRATAARLAAAESNSALFLATTETVSTDYAAATASKRRRRFRELLLALRRAFTRESDNRRELAVFGLATGEREADLHAACDRVDDLSQELQLELAAQAADGSREFGGPKGALLREAEQCAAERDEKLVELHRIRLAWTAKDDKCTDPKTGARTKAYLRRVYLEGQPPLGRFERGQAGFDRVLNGASGGHAGMLASRAATARRLASEQPTAEERAARVRRLTGRLDTAKADLEHLRTH